MVYEVMDRLRDHGERLSSEAAEIMSVIAGQPIESGVYQDETLEDVIPPVPI